jgi:hypothetical protein
MAMPVSAAIRPGRVSGRRPDASHQRGHRWSLRQPPQTCQLVRAQPDPSGTAAPAGHSRAASGMRAGHGRTQLRGRPPCSAGPWPACPPWCPPQPATVSGCGRGGVWCPLSGPTVRSHGPAVSASGSCRSRCVSAATGSGRLPGVRWWGAATAATPAGAAGQAAGGAARAHRSWPAAPAPRPPRRSAHRVGGR